MTTAFGAPTGSLLDDTGDVVQNLVTGGFYFGGGQDGVPLPARLPADGTASLAVTSCNPATGAITLGPLTAAQTGSNRTCTTAGCLLGGDSGQP